MPEPNDPWASVFTSGDTDTVTPYAGQLWNVGGTQLLGTLIPPTEAGGSAQLKVASSGSVISFTGGTFQTSTGHVVTLSPAGEIQLQAQAGPTPVTDVEVRDIGGGLIGEFDQNGNLINTRVAPTAPAGRAPPAFSGTQAGIQFQNNLAVAEAKRQEALAAGDLVKAREWEAEVTRLQNEFATGEREAGQEFSAEQNALAEEAALKRQRLGVLSNLIQSFIGAQSQARDTLANLQPDPFRFAAVAGGIAPFGTTPQQGFQQQLQQFAGAAVPSFDPSGSAASLEPVIAQLTGAQAPQAPTGFGMAGGGTVPTPFNTMSARMVGEKGPEVMVTSPQGVTILPLGKGAQEGGFFPFQPIPFDRSTLLPALSTSGIFSDFNRVPFAQQGRKFGPTGQQRFQSGIFEGLSGERGTAVNPLGANPFQAGTLSKLGLAPGLMRFGNDPTVYFRDPLTGELRPFSGLEQFQESGFSMGNVVSVRPQDRGQFQFGDVLGPGFDPAQSAGTQGVSSFTKFAAPIIEPTTGTLLPVPFEVAEQLNRLRLKNPTAFNLLLSAYKAADVPPTAVLGSIQSSLSFGSERGAVGLR